MAMVPTTSHNPTLSEVAVGLRHNEWLHDVTVTDVAEAARERHVPVQDGRVDRHWLAAIYFGVMTGRRAAELKARLS